MAEHLAVARVTEIQQTICSPQLSGLTYNGLRRAVTELQPNRPISKLFDESRYRHSLAPWQAATLSMRGRSRNGDREQSNLLPLTIPALIDEA
jgi:hypothetical protein